MDRINLFNYIDLDLTLDNFQSKTRKENFTVRFLKLWPLLYDFKSMRAINLVSEYKFHEAGVFFPTQRRWQFDFALTKFKVAFELNGGGTKGRHFRYEGYQKDMEKLNTATFMGWRVYVLTNSSFTNDNIDFTIHLMTEGLLR